MCVSSTSEARFFQALNLLSEHIFLFFYLHGAILRSIVVSFYPIVVKYANKLDRTRNMYLLVSVIFTSAK